MCDAAYHPRCPRIAAERCAGVAIQPRIARRGIDSSERLGRHLWAVERTLAWFSRFRRLTVRYERRIDIFEAFHHLVAALSCRRFVQRFCQAFLATSD